jgi:hypothetical protein
VSPARSSSGIASLTRLAAIITTTVTENRMMPRKNNNDNSEIFGKSFSHKIVPACQSMLKWSLLLKSIKSGLCVRIVRKIPTGQK